MVDVSGGASAPSGQQRSGASAGVIASFSGLAVLLIFMVQNTADVTVHFLFWSFSGRCGSSFS